MSIMQVTALLLEAKTYDLIASDTHSSESIQLLVRKDSLFSIGLLLEESRTKEATLSTMVIYPMRIQTFAPLHAVDICWRFDLLLLMAMAKLLLHSLTLNPYFLLPPSEEGIGQK